MVDTGWIVGHRMVFDKKPRSYKVYVRTFLTITMTSCPTLTSTSSPQKRKKPKKEKEDVESEPSYRTSSVKNVTAKKRANKRTGDQVSIQTAEKYEASLKEKAGVHVFSRME